MSNINSFFKRLWQSTRFRWIFGIFVVGALIIYLIVRRNAPAPYQFITVTQGSISEIVSVTGNTTPTQSVGLGFNSSGTIAHIYSAVGAHVNRGTVLADLNMGNLNAQLKQAQANVDMETAKLASLQAGATSQDIAVSQTALDKANQDLANFYASIKDVSNDGYSKGNDAVHTQMGVMFTNSSSNPQLLLQTSEPKFYISLSSGAVASYSALNDWQTGLLGINSTSSNDNLGLFLQNNLNYLSTISNLLQNMSAFLSSGSNSLDTATLTIYKNNVSTGIAEVNLASKNLNTLSQNIASQKLVIAQMAAALALKKAGATAEDIQAQQANVENAQASVASVQAKFTDSEIVAPISGVITQFDAKIGQLSSLSTPLVSIMSDSGYEVDAGVSETDIGKILVNDLVTMTLDAFPNETFTGLVFYIAPAETNTQGVINYQVKISFNKLDPRLKSGLTSNIDIQTKHKDNVLILPQYAILQNDQGTFVETVENNVVKQNPVTLGITDQKGNVEIISGVKENEQVLNIGLKVQ